MAYTVSSDTITGLDKTPAESAAQGLGAPSFLMASAGDAAITATQLASTDTVVAFVRLLSTAKLRDVIVSHDVAADSNATPTLALSLDAYYSDNDKDGTPADKVGTKIASILTGQTFELDSATTLTSRADALPLGYKIKPLWSALGLSADPGGYIDLCLAVTTAAATGVAVNVSMDAVYHR